MRLAMLNTHKPVPLPGTSGRPVNRFLEGQGFLIDRLENGDCRIELRGKEHFVAASNVADYRASEKKNGKTLVDIFSEAAEAAGAPPLEAEKEIDALGEGARRALGALLTCDVCGEMKKNAAGMAAHKRFKHPPAIEDDHVA